MATGTPPGICRMDKTESQPSIELDDFTGTPITGIGVIEATIPGRCAAPPAPAITTLIPLSYAYWHIQLIFLEFYEQKL